MEDQELNVSEVTDAGTPEEQGHTSELAAQVAELTGERDRLAGEKADLQDRLLRLQAEFENARRRSEKQRLDFLEFAGMELAGNLLPVLDDFERALKAQGADEAYVQGVRLIYQRLFETLTKMGLEPIETSGKKFDPNLHQAVDRVQTEDVEDQTILDEYQRGYNFRGRLLRPAMVKVAVRP